MFTRINQAEALKAEGLWVEKIDDSLAMPYHGPKDPRNKDLPYRPVIDVSCPPNLLDETHQARCMGQAGVMGIPMGFNSLIGQQQQVEYMDALHPVDGIWMGAKFGAICGCIRIYAHHIIGGVRMTTPRIGIFGGIYMQACVLRFTITGTILGSFNLVYECLWKYVPGFQHDVVSDYAHKQAWKEGQQAYRAKAVATLCFGFAAWFHTGIARKFWGAYLLMLPWTLYGEYGRQNFNAGMRIFFAQQANKEMNTLAQMGSLMPNMDKRLDPDTGKTEMAGQYRYYQVTQGLLRDVVWENNTHENFPMHSKGLKFANPYFNWQKTKQQYADAPVVVKNDLWDLPEVMSSRMRSGALDFR